NLTRINASFGVSIGDEIITSVARLIQTRLGHENGFAFHASNTFGVVLNGMDMQAMRRAAERLISAVREAKFETSVCPLTAAISVGGLLLPDQAATATDAMSKALEALERARLEEPAGFV